MAKNAAPAAAGHTGMMGGQQKPAIAHKLTSRARHGWTEAENVMGPCLERLREQLEGRLIVCGG